MASSLTLVADAANHAEIAFLPAPTTAVTVSSGVTSIGLVVASGSTLTVNAGGKIVGTTVFSGATATVAGRSGTIVSAGGTETLLGSANADQIYGLQLVSNGTALVTVRPCIPGA